VVTFKGMKEYMDFRDVVHAMQDASSQGDNVFQVEVIEAYWYSYS
jgi:aconitase B